MKLLLVIFCCVTYHSIYSQTNATTVYEVDTRIQIHDLRKYTFVLNDTSDQITEKEILSGKFDHLFQPYLISDKKILPFTTYWLKVSLKPSSDFKDWTMILKDEAGLYKKGAANDYVDVYTINQNKQVVDHQRTGPLVPKSQKSIPTSSVLNAFTFSGNALKEVSLYIKLRNEDAPPNELFYPQLQSPVIPLETLPDNGLNIFTAITLLFTIMSFFFYFFTKDKSYLLFGIYTFLLSQHYLILHPGRPFVDLYIPEHPWLANPAFTFIASISQVIFILFGRTFMNLKTLSYNTDRFVRWFLVVYTAFIFAELVFMLTTRHNLFAPFHVLVFMVVTVFLVIRISFFKSFEAKVFVAGALWLFCFAILGMLMNYKVITLPFNPWPVSQLGQLIIYCLGLAYKIRLNERAKAEAEQIKGLEDIKSRFFANISHEFRTPLTLIQGPLQQIEEAIPDKQKQTGSVNVPWRQIKTMRRHTDRLLELVNQLLDLSKLDSGKMKLRVIKGDILQMLRVLTSSFESMAERKSIHYHTHFPEQTVMAFFDKDKLDKIVCNLLANAFKYTPVQGKVSVIIETEDNRLRISVEDTGSGIPKKELDKVFDRFYQVEGTEDKGSGIGLALVKELVDLYRGQISVSSEPGKGSRFKVSLPIDKNAFKEDEIVYGEWKEPEPAYLKKPLVEAEEKDFVQKTKSLQLPLLLIVEDNTDLRNFICETVQQHYQVIQAANGKEGLEKAIAEVPDIIVSDVMMPVMDGFTLTEKLKKDERTSHIPVILLTAKAGQQHKIEGLETGADDYLIKPFDSKELLTRIQNLVNQRKLLRKKFAGEILLKPSEVSVNSADENFLQKVMHAIEKNMAEEDFGVEELAREVAMSRSQLHRKLVSLTGQSPSEVLRNTRLLRAKELLLKKAATPSEVAYQVGFNSHTYFSKCFKEEFGISPSEVKN